MQTTKPEDTHKNEAKLNENLISSILNQKDLESLRDNLANLGVIDSPKKATEPPKGQIANPKKSTKKKPEGLLVKRARRKRKPKKILPYNERTLADIIDDKVSGKPTKADVRNTLFKHFKAERARKKLKKVSSGEKSQKVKIEEEFLEDKLEIGGGRNATLADFFASTPQNPSPGSRKKAKIPTKWDESETKHFYNVLEMLGLDFTLMEQFFTKRSRKQLLRKFHKEKKKNPKMVEKALEGHQRTNDSKTRRYKNFLESHKNASDLFSENATSNDSLDNTIHSKLKILLKETGITKELNNEEIKPIDFYLKKIDKIEEEEPKVKIDLEKANLLIKSPVNNDEESTTADIVTNSSRIDEGSKLRKTSSEDQKSNLLSVKSDSGKAKVKEKEKKKISLLLSGIGELGR